MKFFTLTLKSFVLSLLTITIAACSSANKSNETVADDGPLATAEEMEEAEETVEEPKLKFSSAQEAIDYMDSSADSEHYRKGILYSMATDSLDYCTRLLNNEFPYFIIVDKGDMQVRLYDKFGVLKKSYPCACGKGYGNKRRKGDCRTPEGFFKAGSVKNSSDWHYTDENGNRSKNPGQYGPRFVRIVTPGFNSTGIHGTDAPWSVGGRRSHGCVRIKNENILELAKYVTKGMPIIILPGGKDREVNWRELHPELFHKSDSTERHDPSAAKDSLKNAAEKTGITETHKDSVA